MSLRDRLRRFERLERPRPSGPEGDERPSAEERFDRVGDEARPAPRAPAPAAEPGSRAGDRFAPPPPRAPDLEQRSDEEQPFLRCMRCETDCSRYAAACSTCGEELHTEAQQAYNQKLWAARRQEREALERENAALRAAQASAEAEAAEARRLAAAEMAREVGERERRRLDGREGWGGGSLDPFGLGDPTPFFFRILRAISSPAWRLAFVGGVVLLAATGVVLALRFRLALVLVVVLLAALFSPRRSWRRRLWW